jgi:transcriptional regulator with XRE-family HTH domain
MSRKRDPETTAVSTAVQRGFGKRLKQERNRKGTKQHTLAADLRLTRTSVSNIERARHRIFLDQVYIAAHSLGVDIQELLPPLSEVFPEKPVSFVSDDPLSQTSALAASEFAQNLREQLVAYRIRTPRRR